MPTAISTAAASTANGCRRNSATVWRPTQLSRVAYLPPVHTTTRQATERLQGYGARHSPPGPHLLVTPPITAKAPGEYSRPSWSLQLGPLWAVATSGPGSLPPTCLCQWASATTTSSRSPSTAANRLNVVLRDSAPAATPRQPPASTFLTPCGNSRRYAPRRPVAYGIGTPAVVAASLTLNKSLNTSRTRLTVPPGAGAPSAAAARLHRGTCVRGRNPVHRDPLVCHDGQKFSIG